MFGNPLAGCVGTYCSAAERAAGRCCGVDLAGGGAGCCGGGRAGDVRCCCGCGCCGCCEAAAAAGFAAAAAATAEAAVPRCSWGGGELLRSPEPENASLKMRCLFGALAGRAVPADAPATAVGNAPVAAGAAASDAGGAASDGCDDETGC